MAELKQLSPECVALVGRIAENEVLEIRAALEDAVARRASAGLDVDLSGLDSVGAEVLSVLLCALRKAGPLACDMSLVNIPAKLLEMAKVGGLESLLPFAEA